MTERKKLYSLTPEHRAQLEPWRDKWIANAMSTAAMTHEDRVACTEAVFGLYEAAKIPAPKAVVFVPSPFVLAFAGGFAAAAIKNGKPLPPMRQQQIENPLWNAIYRATHAATQPDQMSIEAGRENFKFSPVIRTISEARVFLAQKPAAYPDFVGSPETRDDDGIPAADQLTKWYYLGCDMRALANELDVGTFGLRCAASSWRMWQGGNQWSGYDAFLSFFQDIAKLDLPVYEQYKHWRVLAERSGPRVVHPDFCIISDRPEVLTVDERNRPHSERGPFCRWRDGSSLYAVHGVRVPGWLIEYPDKLDIKAISSESNTEVQRLMIERYGWNKYVHDIGGETVDHHKRWGTLLRTPSGLVLKVTNRSPEPDGTFREYMLPVADECEPLPDPNDPNGRLGQPQPLTALNAVASTFGMTGKEYESVLAWES